MASWTETEGPAPLAGLTQEYVANLPDTVAAHSLLVVYDVLHLLDFSPQEIESAVGEVPAANMRLLAGETPDACG